MEGFCRASHIITCKVEISYILLTKSHFVATCKIKKVVQVDLYIRVIMKMKAGDNLVVSQGIPTIKQQHTRASNI